MENDNLKYSYKAIVINPTHGDHHDKIHDSSLFELNRLLSSGWVIERETVLPCSVSAPAYKGLSAVIYILKIQTV